MALFTVFDAGVDVPRAISALRKTTVECICGIWTRVNNKGIIVSALVDIVVYRRSVVEEVVVVMSALPEPVVPSATQS